MAVMTLKSLEGEGFGLCMAKRLSKALRGKRRWLGVAFASSVQTRSQANKSIESAFGHLIEAKPIRLMDFHAHGSEQAVQTQQHLAVDPEAVNGVGYGILEVPHELNEAVRMLAQSPEALDDLSLMSLTSSGKIRLVRERLVLARPPRRR
jgi:vacuolar-type H+-ATPase subunit D/Vma8